MQREKESKDVTFSIHDAIPDRSRDGIVSQV